MENNNIEEAIKLNIESWNKAGYPIPEAYKNWCIEHGRDDLLGGNKPNLSAETAFLPLPSRGELAAMFGIDLPADLAHESAEKPATEADMGAMINLAIEQMARDLGVEIPTKESMPGELLSMEEIFEKE